jgi:hypothetical protein
VDTGIRTETAVESLNLVSWSEEVSKACADKLSKITTPANAAGVAACYNVPVLLSSEGVFLADLRLFQVAPATGDWQNIDHSTSNNNNYSVSVVFDNAAATARNLSTKEVDASDTALNGTSLSGKMVQDYQFIGQLDSTVLAKDLSDPALKPMLIPTMQLLATTTTGSQISLAINASDAQFVTGVFSNITDNEVQAAAKAPFKLPGTKILITPIGLYLFSAYMALALAIFGYGTIERARYRDQYRKRLAMAGPMTKS